MAMDRVGGIQKRKSELNGMHYPEDSPEEALQMPHFSLKGRSL